MPEMDDEEQLRVAAVMENIPTPERQGTATIENIEMLPYFSSLAGSSENKIYSNTSVANSFGESVPSGSSPADPDDRSMTGGFSVGESSAGGRSMTGKFSVGESSAGDRSVTGKFSVGESSAGGRSMTGKFSVGESSAGEGPRSGKAPGGDPSGDHLDDEAKIPENIDIGDGKEKAHLTGDVIVVEDGQEDSDRPPDEDMPDAERAANDQINITGTARSSSQSHDEVVSLQSGEEDSSVEQKPSTTRLASRTDLMAPKETGAKNYCDVVRPNGTPVCQWPFHTLDERCFARFSCLGTIHKGCAMALDLTATVTPSNGSPRLVCFCSTACRDFTIETKEMDPQKNWLKYKNDPLNKNRMGEIFLEELCLDRSEDVWMLFGFIMSVHIKDEHKPLLSVVKTWKKGDMHQVAVDAGAAISKLPNEQQRSRLMDIFEKVWPEIELTTEVLPPDNEAQGGEDGDY